MGWTTGEVWALGAVVGFMAFCIGMLVGSWGEACHQRRLSTKDHHRACRCDDCLRVYGWPPILPSTLPAPPMRDHRGNVFLHNHTGPRRDDDSCPTCNEQIRREAERT